MSNNMNFLEGFHITQEEHYDRMCIQIRGPHGLLKEQFHDFMSSVGNAVSFSFDLNEFEASFLNVDVLFSNKNKQIKKYKKQAMFK